MTLFGTEIRYGTVAQAFHWVTAILVLSAWLVAGGDRSPTITLHETLGVAVITMVAIRLIWRLFDRQPDIASGPRAMTLASQLVHWALYALLIAIPLSAIVGTQLEGHAVTIYGFGSIGPFLTTSRQLGHQILEVHQTIGTLIIWLAGFHAAAALFHHFFMKDGVLRAMLPGGRPA
jgi:cytochrome b561